MEKKTFYSINFNTVDMLEGGKNKFGEGIQVIIDYYRDCAILPVQIIKLVTEVNLMY